MLSGSSIAGEPPVAAPPPDHYSDKPAGGWRKYALAAGFLAPAAFLLLIWVVYPAISTIYRSFFDKSGDEFVWFDNYTALFSNDRTLTAIAVVLLLCWSFFYFSDDTRGYKPVDTSVAMAQINSDNVKSAQIDDREQQLRLELKSGNGDTENSD